MKVNISYAVELEDVPIEVGKLLTNVVHYMSGVLNDLEEVGTSNPTQAIESISNIREGLKNVDLRLADCSNILSGYVDLQNRSTFPGDSLEVEEEDSDAGF